MRIHNKFMVFFIIVLSLMCAITLIIYKNSQESIGQYDRILQRFLVLNEISQNTDEINHVFQDYLLVQNEERLEDFEQYKAEIYSNQAQFTEVISPQYDTSLSKNYYHMLSYFIDQMERSLETQTQEQTTEHFIYREEVEKVATWLNETTLRLINHELEDYHQLHSDSLMQNQFHLSFAIYGAMSLFAISLLFTYFMSKRILSPIHRLVEQANELSTGNFDVKDVEVTNDEVGVLSETFNQMKRNVKQLFVEIKQRAKLEQKLQDQEIKNIETHRLLKEMELRSLQNQMNPHFLFNTLNVVSKMAYIEGAEKSSDLVVSISKLLRYNLRPLEKAVTLRDEISHVKEYIEIQQVRFSERIVVEIKIETNDLDIPIPLLTLQPIVENAFIHGVDAKESGGEICIRVFERNHAVVAEISDNGEGIDADVLKELTDEPKGHLTGIGLMNVQKRLRMFYDKDDTVKVNSTLGYGTTIQLSLPKTNEAERWA
ncbi:sensor histidine kinase [Alteribacter populi]|uniref:sensor histidine kinase n=1 Tax=Alteribacter populi TaxID=2011011 RepID=UPI000BBAC72F|nr:sensor histidine kinase [Alteribacter populi]